MTTVGIDPDIEQIDILANAIIVANLVIVSRCILIGDPALTMCLAALTNNDVCASIVEGSLC